MEATTTTDRTTDCDVCQEIVLASDLAPIGGEDSSLPEGMACTACRGF
jgi:hypothetical protein